MDENKIISFLGKHWTKILLGVLAVACILVWTERLLGSHRHQSKQDYVVASQILEQFRKGESLPQESIEIAEGILARHPELRPKFDSILALAYFSQANSEKGIYYARSVIERAATELPAAYRDYAQASLFISQKRFKEAFEAALSLYKKLKDSSDYSTLDAMNTLRLVFLSEILGKEEEKKIYWEKLEKHTGYHLIEPLFHEGRLSLPDFVKFTSS